MTAARRRAPAGSIELAEASDFDPPPGDQAEHPEEAGFAIDNGNEQTGWVGEHYDTADFGGLKDGVGDLRRRPRSRSSRSRSRWSPPEPGWAAEVYSATSGPPDSLEEWDGPIGTLANGDTESTIPLEPTEPSQYFLLWFTVLAPASDDDRFRPEVSDIQLIGLRPRDTIAR